MKEVEDQLSDEEKTKINEAISALEEAAKGDDKEAITQKASDLYTAIVPIAQAKNKPEQASAEPEIIDAEFKEQN
jgi:molecular chaperone DnaK